MSRGAERVLCVMLGAIVMGLLFWRCDTQLVDEALRQRMDALVRLNAIEARCLARAEGPTFKQLSGRSSTTEVTLGSITIGRITMGMSGGGRGRDGRPLVGLEQSLGSDHDRTSLVNKP